MARPAGELAADMVMLPPMNFLCRMVLLESRLRTSAALPRSVEQSRSMGARRSLENASQSASRGCTNRIGPGSRPMM